MCRPSPRVSAHPLAPPRLASAATAAFRAFAAAFDFSQGVSSPRERSFLFRASASACFWTRSCLRAWPRFQLRARRAFLGVSALTDGGTVTFPSLPLLVSCFCGALRSCRIPQSGSSVDGAGYAPADSRRGSVGTTCSLHHPSWAGFNSTPTIRSPLDPGVRALSQGMTQLAGIWRARTGPDTLVREIRNHVIVSPQ